MGVLDLDTMNKCLLGKWLWNLKNGNGLWQEILRKKYLTNITLSQVRKKPGDSHFWSSLMDVKDTFLSLCHRKVGDGTKTSF